MQGNQIMKVEMHNHHSLSLLLVKVKLIRVRKLATTSLIHGSGLLLRLILPIYQDIY